MEVKASAKSARGSERGAAIFIVVLVLTMLTAVGIFAMRASSLSGAASGYERQTTQNQTVAEYGIVAMAAELSTDRRSVYITNTLAGKDQCPTQQTMYGDGGVTIPCYTVYDKDLAENGVVAFRPSSSGDGGTDPGSFGALDLEGEFQVQITDPGPAAIPLAGYQLGKGQGKQVTLTSTGQVHPIGLTDEATGVVSGNAMSRAYVVVPE